LEENDPLYYLEARSGFHLQAANRSKFVLFSSFQIIDWKEKSYKILLNWYCKIELRLPGKYR